MDGDSDFSVGRIPHAPYQLAPLTTYPEIFYENSETLPLWVCRNFVGTLYDDHESSQSGCRNCNTAKHRPHDRRRPHLERHGLLRW